MRPKSHPFLILKFSNSVSRTWPLDTLKTTLSLQQVNKAQPFAQRHRFLPDQE